MLDTDPPRADADAVDPAKPSAAVGQSGERATCRCGYGRDHLMVSADCKYTMWGWFWVTFVGVTTRPIQVNYRCRVCGQTFDKSVDDADLSRHT